MVVVIKIGPNIYGMLILCGGLLSHFYDIVSFVNRVPDSNSQGFILQFLMSDEASLYTAAGKPVAFVLDLMKLDVPDLFASPPHNTTSERFQKNLHTYISTNGLSRDLLKNVDKLMVSNHHIFCM